VAEQKFQGGRQWAIDSLNTALEELDQIEVFEDGDDAKRMERAQDNIRDVLDQLHHFIREPYKLFDENDRRCPCGQDPHAGWCPRR